MLNNVFNFIKSRTFIIIIVCLFGLAILAGSFAVGVFVGYAKARFSYAWGENYHKNFGGPRGGLMRDLGKDFSGGDFIGAHGTFGQIIKIDPSTDLGQAAVLVIRGKDNVEKIVLIKNDTEIRRFQDVIQIGDLKIDELVTVIGEPNDAGQIIAKFIRILPAPSPTMFLK